jgi:hypothetical protein
MTIFKQGDPRWGSVTMGKSGVTLARAGCTTTDIAMAYNWFYGSSMTPGQCAGKLNYNNAGEIIWNSLVNIKMKLVSRIYGKNEIEINKALANPNEVCILQVNGNHWLFLIGRKIPLLGYKVSDPLYGDACYTSRYKSNITGCAILAKI